MDKYQLGDYRNHGPLTRQFGSLRKQAVLAVKINEERIALGKALAEMTTLNEKLIRDFNGRTPPWEQLDEEHLHDASVLLRGENTFIPNGANIERYRQGGKF